MKLSLLFIINSIFALVGGLGLLLMPQQFMSPYGATLNAAGVFVAQIFGVILVGLAVIYYLARNVEDQTTKKALLGGGLISHVGSGLLGIQAVITGVLNTTIWVDVVLHLVIAAGFCYYLFEKK